MTEIFEATITQFSKKGNGLCHLEKENSKAKLVEVPFTIPGDTVRFTLLRKDKGLYTSRLQEIVTPSPDRETPRCIHYGTCGGCRWQNLPYSKQLLLKQELVEKTFPNFPVQPIVPCEPPWQYRNKMEFSFSNDAAGNKYLGLIMDSSKGKVLNLQACHLVNPWFIDALKATREWWQQTNLSAYHPPKDAGSLRTLTLREGMRTGDRLAMLTVSGNPDFALHRRDLDSFVSALRQTIESPEHKLSIFLRIHQAKKGLETNFYEILLHGPDQIQEIFHINGQTLKFSISPSAFFQPNTQQAEKLYSLALQMLNLPPNSTVYDLYCGTGTLGICLANQAKHVIGIEISPESSLDAKTNIKNNNITNMTILTGPVSHILSQNNSLPSPDAIIVDPPRAGLDPQTIQHLSHLKPKLLLYISCNPLTQAQNISELPHFHLKALQPVDQFPHTTHIENIAILESL